MPSAYTYDVAISAVAQDAATAHALAAALRRSFPLAVFDGTGREHAAADAGGRRLAADVLARDARVVVVLLQRLWGSTASTREAERVLAGRAAAEGSGFLHVVALEVAAPRTWMPRQERWGTLAGGEMKDAVDAIAAVVETAGGVAHDETFAEFSARTVREEAEAEARDGYLRSSKAIDASGRAFDAVVEEIERRLPDLRAIAPGVPVALQRMPTRCIVQAGEVGFSLSWFESRTETAAEGSLLLIEWEGTIVGRGGAAPAPGQHATPRRERVYHPDGLPSVAILWRAEEPDGRIFSSVHLAAQCVQVLQQQMQTLAAARG